MKSHFSFAAILAIGAAVLTGCAGQGSDSRPAADKTTQTPFSSLALSSEDLAALLAEKDALTFVVDVRTPTEYQAGAIPGAVNIPYDTLKNNLPTQEKTARIVVYCRSGNRSSIAKKTLVDLGYSNVNDFGAVSRWKGELVIRQ